VNAVHTTAVENQGREHSVFKAPVAGGSAFVAAMRVRGNAVEGTIGAAAAPADEQFYGSGSRVLLTDLPLASVPRALAAARRIRANDLVTELREISGHVNRMMAQVDRAIHRLGIHVGEPLRR
jgi:hypothetical protein